MPWTVEKDGMRVLCETEAELLIAIAAIRQAPEPAWRVGGPPDPKPLSPIVMMGDGSYQHEDGSPLTSDEQAVIDASRYTPAPGESLTEGQYLGYPQHVRDALGAP